MRSTPGSAVTSSRNGRAGGGATYGSPGPGPAVASSNAAVSRTVSVTACSVEQPPRPSPAYGDMVLRARAGLRPTTPQQAAGARIEPKPSLACADGGGGAAARPAGDPGEIPGRPRRPVELRLARERQPELARVRPAEDH